MMKHNIDISYFSTAAWKTKAFNKITMNLSEYLVWAIM